VRITVQLDKDAVCFDDPEVKCRNMVMNCCEIAVNTLVAVWLLFNSLLPVCGAMLKSTCWNRCIARGDLQSVCGEHINAYSM